MTKFLYLIILIIFSILLMILVLIYRNAFKPIYTILALIWYTLMICLLIILWTWESIYSIIIFLIIIRGIFTIFIYFASLINNQNLLTNTPTTFYIVILINIIITIILISGIIIVQHTTHKEAVIATRTITTYFIEGKGRVRRLDKERPFHYNNYHDIRKRLSFTKDITTVPYPSSPSDLSSSITIIYHNPWWYFTIICILLLLLSLFLTIKICTSQNKSIRKINTYKNNEDI